jgi:hypothetical protein
MTRSAIELVPDEQDVRIAHFAAAAILLSVAESAIPLPLPGVKRLSRDRSGRARSTCPAGHGADHCRTSHSIRKLCLQNDSLGR